MEIVEQHRELYKILNSEYTSKYLHLFGRGRGFSAEFIHLLKAVSACLFTKIQFCLQTNTRPEGFAVDNGWIDYFEPLFPEVSVPHVGVLNRSHFPLGRIALFQNICKPILKWSSGCDLFLFDGIGHPPPAQIDIPQLGLDKTYWENMQHLCHLLWKYNSKTKEEIGDIGKVTFSQPYIASHIRRGDKISEASFISIETYLSAIRQHAGSIRTLYIATDDYTVVAPIREKLGPSYYVHCRTEHEFDSGYDQNKFNATTRHNRRIKTLLFLWELQILFGAERFLGTSTSNVFNLVRYMKGDVGVIDLGN